MTDTPPVSVEAKPNAVPGLTPKQTVAELDKYIIGQEDAKKAVAIALRNRARRRLLSEDLQEEIHPKNIIMIGSTGVGKTEIARRLAKLEDAPFIKIEATKFTEVGYVGRDVESIIRDLVEMAVSHGRASALDACRAQAEKNAEDRILDLLVPNNFPRQSAPPAEGQPPEDPELRMMATRERFREMLREGTLEEREVEIDVQDSNKNVVVGIPPNMGFEEMGIDLRDMVDKMMPTKHKRKKMKVEDARPILVQEEADRLLDMEEITQDAVDKVEESGIVFLDEIDKVVGRDSGSGPDVSRSGVQRDILPLVEGSTVYTKHGMVKTDHILFIAAGAFHGCSPSDLMPELQGRFPIRVELDDLDADDFKRILTEPKNSLIRQYKDLLQTEGVTIEFEDDAIDELAGMAASINDETENIGARRLHTILESVLDVISFDAPEMAGQTIKIDRSYVKEQLGEIVNDADLSRYIL